MLATSTGACPSPAPSYKPPKLPMSESTRLPQVDGGERRDAAHHVVGAIDVDACVPILHDGLHPAR
jgi:hypothetical protein